jgi:uncharacterized membrane protein
MPQNMSKNIDFFSKSRVETFSDGIFAIIVTLLVLELKVPMIDNPADANELFAALIALLPKLISWMISFFTVCVIWVNHHRLFKIFNFIDHGLFWWNAVLLLWCSFIPFPTAALGDYPNNQTAVILYGIVMMCMALTFSLMRIYTGNKHDLLHPDTDIQEFKTGTIYSIVFGPVLYMFGALVSIIHPYFSFVIYLGIAIYFIFPHATKAIEVSTKN